MNTLNLLYENTVTSPKLTDRKISINGGKILLKGAYGSGKSEIIRHYLASMKSENYIYVALDDIRINADCLRDLGEFVASNPQIKTIAVDGISENTPNLAEISQISVPNLILATENKKLNLPNFTDINLLPLDFEEFMSFDKRSDENAIFASFLQRGNNPNTINSSDTLLQEQRNLYAKFDKISILTLAQSSNFMGKNLSTNQIYLSLKAHFKVSKDTIYKNISHFVDSNLIYLLPNFSPNSKLNKLYFSNFIYKDVLNLKKDFLAKFNNAVFCELLKLKNEIFFTNELDFFIPEIGLGVLVVPFSASDFIFLKFNKMIENLKNLGVKRLAVITMTNSGNSEIQGIKCDILPFYRFALGL